MIKPWLFDIFMYTGSPRPEEFDPQLCGRIYQEYLDRWIAAEERGFEGIFFAEHHFTTYNLSPAPNLLVAAVATRTERLLLGVMCNAVPLHDPLRLAEENAMLDHLTRGRLQIGLGPGAGAGEAQTMGIPDDEVRPRYHEGADVVVQALGNVRFSHHGRFHDYENVPVRPRVQQQPMPPVWVAATSEASAIWAAERGFRMTTAWGTDDYVKQLFATYQEAAAAAGQPTGPERVGVRRKVFVADTDEQAHELAGTTETGHVEIVFPHLPPAQREQMRAMMSVPDDSIIGSPDTVAQRLIEQAHCYDAGHMLCWTDFRPFPRAALDRCHELLGRVNEKLRADISVTA